MPNVLITGANRGLGLEFARQYAHDGWHVIGTARHPEKAEALHDVAHEVMALDMADSKSIEAFAAGLERRPIDLLIANAGMYGPHTFDAAQWAETLRVNTIAPTELAIALKQHVLSGSLKTMVALSSQLGSIADNDSGGMLAYRSSKAALNAAWKSLAIDWKEDGLTLVTVHPGWVQTDMGGANAPLTPEESVTGLRKVIAGLGPDKSGRFFNYRGESLAW